MTMQHVDEPGPPVPGATPPPPRTRLTSGAIPVAAPDALARARSRDVVLEAREVSKNYGGAGAWDSTWVSK